MNASQQIAKHFHEVFFSGNWTASNLKDALEDVSWKEAITPIEDLNTIATLVFHSSYYVREVLKVLKGGSLDASDKHSFTHPPINSEEDWNNFLAIVWSDAEKFSQQIALLPEETLYTEFTNPDYGIYFRNLFGIVEHTHYHLGQIALIKKMLKAKK